MRKPTIDERLETLTQLVMENSNQISRLTVLIERLSLHLDRVNNGLEQIVQARRNHERRISDVEDRERPRQ